MCLEAKHHFYSVGSGETQLFHVLLQLSKQQV